MKLSLDTITKRIEELTEGLGAVASLPASPGELEIEAVENVIAYDLRGELTKPGRYYESTAKQCIMELDRVRRAKPAAGGTNPLSLELIAAYSFIVSVLNFPRRLHFDCHCPECNTERLIIAGATAAYERALDTGTNEDDGGGALADARGADAQEGRL